MSLFPSAQHSKETLSDNDNGSTAWLTNKSFASSAKHPEKLKSSGIKTDPKLNNQRSGQGYKSREESSSDTSSSESSSDSTIVQEKVEKQKLIVKKPVDKKPIKRKRDEEAVNDESFDLFTVDLKGDKNFLYFQRPFQTWIPKYWRASPNCMGLPRNVKIIFKEEKKKRKKYAEPPLERYFHLDDSYFVQEEEERKKQEEKDGLSEVERMNQLTRNNPHDIAAWTKFVELQEKLSCKNKALVCEKQVSILDKAISYNTHSIELKLKRLQILDSVSEDTEREWENLVFRHSESLRAWERYLHRVMTSTRFTLRRALNAFARAIASLSALRRRHRDDEQRKTRCEEMLMEVGRRAVTVLESSGHHERAYYLLALMVDVNLRLEDDDDEVDVDDVERFCATQPALIGQQGWKGFDAWLRHDRKGGWSSVMTSSDEGEGGDDDDDDDFELDPSLSLTQNWTRLERIRSSRDFLPWRSKSECEDEKRKVSYEQVKGLFFFVESDASKAKLVEMLLEVIGFARRRHPRHLAHPCQLIHRCSRHVTASVSHHCTPHRKLDACPLRARLGAARHRVVERVLSRLTQQQHQLRARFGLVWLEYHRLRVEACRTDEARRKSGKKARLVARALLQPSSPHDGALWLELARIELAAGKADECRKIVRGYLVTSNASSPLALAMCRLLSEAGDGDGALRVLVSLADANRFRRHLGKDARAQVSGATLLRAGKFFVDRCEELACLYEGTIGRDEDGKEADERSELCVMICCSLLLAHLSSPRDRDKFAQAERQLAPHVRKLARFCGESTRAGGDLREVRSVQVEVRRRLWEASGDEEGRLQFRESLLQGLDHFPTDSEFALPLCQMESAKAFVTSDTRKYFSLPEREDDRQRRHTYVTHALFRHLPRHNNNNNAEDEGVARGAVNRIVGSLERAISYEEADADDEYLWRLLLAHTPRPSSALVARALAACPWSKSLLVELAERGLMEGAEATRLMNERGLRLRTPYEEVEMLKQLQDDNDDDDDE